MRTELQVEDVHMETPVQGPQAWNLPKIELRGISTNLNYCGFCSNRLPIRGVGGLGV